MSIDWGKFAQIAKAIVRAERGAENLSAPEPKRINLCTEIQCPCAYRTSLKASSGCNRYPTAHQCHLVRTWPDLRKEATAYFLYYDTDLVSVSGLKKRE